MRASALVFATVVAALLLLPEAGATATPVLEWPSPAFVDRDAASSFAPWLAGRLGAQVDPLRPPRWDAGNGTSGPEFLNVTERYILPLTDGEVEARYLANGLLMDAQVRSNTTYVAASANEADLRALADRIATDIGLDTSRANWTLEYAVSAPETPQEERDWIAGFVGLTSLGYPLYFNAMEATVRESDLRTTAVRITAWYAPSGEPDVSASGAVAIALAHARADHNASDPSGATTYVTVRNGTSFVYLVFVSWPGPETYSWWVLDVWVDATTGEIVYEEGPALAFEGGIPSGMAPPWAALGLAALAAVLVALGLFYRLSAERALDQFTRGGIFGYVLANPGSSYTRVRDALRLSNGTLAYHLWILERTGFVRSVRQGRFRLLYPEGVPVRKGSLALSRVQYAILDLLHDRGPMPQVEIARQLGLSRQRAHYNVKALRALSLVQPTPDGETALSASGAETVAESRHQLASTSEAAT